MAISHGFNKTEAATSVSAPVSVNSGLQVIVGTAQSTIRSICHYCFCVNLIEFRLDDIFVDGRQVSWYYMYN